MCSTSQSGRIADDASIWLKRTRASLTQAIPFLSQDSFYAPVHSRVCNIMLCVQNHDGTGAEAEEKAGLTTSTTIMSYY